MTRSIRGAARAVLDVWPLSRFRSFAERRGVIGFALTLIFALCRPLLAQDSAAGRSAGRTNQRNLPDRGRA